MLGVIISLLKIAEIVRSIDYYFCCCCYENGLSSFTLTGIPGFFVLENLITCLLKRKLQISGIVENI